ncbi:MAG: metalloregulator ArsR/SmtB family transcription factor [Boseongicola sp.]
MVERDEAALTDILKAAADPTRRTILTLLSQNGPMRVTDLAERFDVSLNSVSKHIKTLESAGLVSRRTEWREHLIELRPDRIALIDQWFNELRSIWSMRLEALETIISKDKPMTDTAAELSMETSRTIAAPRDKLFDAWLDADMLAQFMMPAPNMSVPEANSDPREGGRFKIVMLAGDQEMPHEGTYKTIDRPNRLAFTWESPFSTLEDSTVTVDFAEAQDGTEVTLRHVRFPSEEIRDNHQGGWTRILETLSEVV